MKKQFTLSKLFSAVLVVGLLLPTFTPLAAVAQTESQRPLIPLESVIQIPEVTVDGLSAYADISQVDWTQKVTINGKYLALNSDEALNALDLSSDVKEIIRSYRSEKTSIDKKILMWPWDKPEKKAVMDEGLKHAISQSLIEQSQLPADYQNLKAQGRVEAGNNTFDISDFQPVDSNMLTPVDTSAEILDVQPVRTEVKSISLLEKIGEFVKGTFNQIVAFLTTDNAYADVATVNEDAINYLINEQNDDGSWGIATSTKFITTAAALDALISNGVVGTTTQKGYVWMSTNAPGNNDFLAQKVNLLTRMEPGTTTATTTAQAITALVSGLDDATGGFAYDNEYNQDPVTTAKVIQALHAADYEDEGAEPNVTASLAIHYLINTQSFNEGWSVTNVGPGTLPATTEVVEALLLWKHRTLGATAVDDTLSPALASLINT